MHRAYVELKSKPCCELSSLVFKLTIVMKPGRVFRCMFLFAILGVNPAQNLAKHKSIEVTSIAIYNSCSS